ncbi:MAG: EAL domain-containing protein [Acidimicrobiales bacterium]
MTARRNGWTVVAGLLFVVGVTGSLFGARAIVSNQSQKSRQQLATSATQITESLRETLVHEQDLTITAAAFVGGDPSMSQSAFARWMDQVQAFARYPEVLSIGELAMVTASQLPVFEAAEDRLAIASGSATPYAVSPPGRRPYYCLPTVSVHRNGVIPPPSGVDYCTTPVGAALREARDSGQSAYLPFKIGNAELLVVGSAVYQGGSSPTTVAGRRARVVGWLGTEIQPGTFLDSALVGHRDTMLRLSFRGSSQKVTFQTGSAPVGAASVLVRLPDSWQVQILGPVVGSGLLSNGTALPFLIAGSVFFLLLAILVYALSTGRYRAMRLVEDRTRDLRYQAFHDSLTGLANRALILRSTRQLVTQHQEEGVPFSVLFLDLDDFKDINDTLGHAAGDELLIAVGRRLESVLRDGDSVGRLGGDEFVVLASGASLAAGSQGVADRISDAFNEPFVIPHAGIDLSTTVSIGVVTGDRSDPELLLHDADIALYRAKAQGKNRAVLFDRSMQEEVDDRRKLDLDLHEALARGQFFLAYQPVVSLASDTVKGFEALVRWRHPERGVVMPSEFIPTLESSGLIGSVGTWVLDEACRQGAEWQRQGRRFTISVNVAAAQLDNDGIVDDVCNALEASGLDPGLLVVEPTETTLMNDIRAISGRLQRIRALGAKVAIDDFGTGYSSMSYLQDLPIDCLKLDRSFISRLPAAGRSPSLVRAMIQIAQALDLDVVAEGVENDDQRRWLADEGADFAQGFLFSQPLVGDELDRFVEGTTHVDAEFTGQGFAQVAASGSGISTDTW